ncbi:hypothetical protein MNBD_GAMMA18-255 [hydrothermal vent metagenome]|uniref:NHL repeat domain protein n=1 Tax=hydrothermal vent metagenome TaxID=652676 RepID=A0A3B0Z9H2_9ZZZZ
MSQYSQRHWRYSLGVIITVVLVLAGCGSSQTVVSSDHPMEESALSDEMPEASDAGQSASNDEVDIDASADSVFGDIYSSFTQEMAKESGIDTATETSKLPPIEYLYSIGGGNDAVASDVPTWVTGERFLRFLQPSGFDLYNGELYILDSARQSMFRYQPDGEKIITVLDLAIYLRGDADSVSFSDEGYYFISEPLSSRVLKFNDQHVLVDVYKDKANLANPTKLYYDDEQKKLYVSDGVFGRIMVFSKQGRPLYALGKRGTAKGEFIRISDFINHGGNVIVTDSIGKKPMQVISNDGEFLHAYTRRVLGIPGAIAIDAQERIYVADHSDDSIRIFLNGELRWRFGGSGTEPGKFRVVTQMRVYEDKLYVLDSLNRRIQVFQIND